MGLLRVTKFADLHIMVPHYALCEDTVEMLQYMNESYFSADLISVSCPANI